MIIPSVVKCVHAPTHPTHTSCDRDRGAACGQPWVCGLSTCESHCAPGFGNTCRLAPPWSADGYLSRLLPASRCCPAASLPSTSVARECEGTVISSHPPIMSVVWLATRLHLTGGHTDSLPDLVFRHTTAHLYRAVTFESVNLIVLSVLPVLSLQRTNSPGVLYIRLVHRRRLRCGRPFRRSAVRTPRGVPLKGPFRILSRQEQLGNVQQAAA